MPSASRILISAAGGGKTTRIVDQALSHDAGVTALVTYTRNNVREIHLKAIQRAGVIPPRVEVISWYSFLLRELARPYRRALHNHRIDGIHWVEGESAQRIPEFRTSAHYFVDGSQIYSDKISKFVCACDTRTGGAVMRRLKQRFNHVIIDEIQDMAGYDIDLLELMIKSGVRVTLVGDHRQATFATNRGKKNKAFGGPAIINKFKAWEKAGLLSINYEQHTYRCHQDIADLGDGFFPTEPKTISRNDKVTGHDGIFLVSRSDVEQYIRRYDPQLLRYSSATKCGLHEARAMNFGQSKGLTFERVLIYPHEKAKSWLTSGKLIHVEKSAAKMYVAVTRARYSVAFVYDKMTCAIAASRWTP